MRKKVLKSFEDLIVNYYGNTESKNFSDLYGITDIITNYYGPVRRSKFKNDKNNKQLVFSKSFDNGEVLIQKPSRLPTGEYMVYDSSLADEFIEYVVIEKDNSIAPSTNFSNPDEISLVQESKVDLMDMDSTVNAHVVQDKPFKPNCEERNQNIVTSVPEDKPLPLRGSGSKDSVSMAKATEDDFMSDMHAIINGQKVFDPASGKTIERDKLLNQKPGKTESPAQEQAQPEIKNEHAIFDKIAQSMQYANAYDLGSVDIENRFNDFDSIFDMKERSDLQKKKKKEKESLKQDSSGEVIPNSTDFLKDLDTILKNTENKSAANLTPEPTVSKIVSPALDNEISTSQNPASNNSVSQQDESMPVSSHHGSNMPSETIQNSDPGKDLH
jgi:hypothetical protein